MKRMTKAVRGVVVQFIVKLLLYTLCVVILHFVVYGSTCDMNGMTVAAALLTYGYWNAGRWLSRKLRQIGPQNPEDNSD